MILSSSPTNSVPLKSTPLMNDLLLSSEYKVGDRVNVLYGRGKGQRTYEAKVRKYLHVQYNCAFMIIIQWYILDLVYMYMYCMYHLFTCMHCLSTCSCMYSTLVLLFFQIIEAEQILPTKIMFNVHYNGWNSRYITCTQVVHVHKSYMYTNCTVHVVLVYIHVYACACTCMYTMYFSVPCPFHCILTIGFL